MHSNEIIGKSPELDLEISTKFKSLYHEIESQESKLSELKLEPMEALGCVIVLDQYARNMFRDTPKGEFGVGVDSNNPYHLSLSILVVSTVIVSFVSNPLNHDRLFTVKLNYFSI